MTNNTFSSLKKSSKAQFESLTKEIERLNSKGYAADADLWQPVVDKALNGYAQFHWLPAAEGEDVPFVRQFKHSFKGPTGLWLIENCPTTIRSGNDVCPVCKYNNILWNTQGTNAEVDANQAMV